jgi:hypothetical protein
MKKSLLLFSLFIATVFCFSSCSKTGPTGATGATGSQGPTGPQGPTGTTNVIYSDWFTPPSWTYYIYFSTYYEGFTQPASAITQDIIDNGVILTYIQPVNTPGTIQQLPITNSGGGSTVYFESLASVGNIVFQCYDILDPTEYPAAQSVSNQFRYVIIPGSQLTSGAIHHVPPPDFKDYTKVCEYYHIPK